MEEEWIFTFMQKDERKNNFVIIKGSYGEVRAEMFKRFGDKWAFQYGSKEEAGVDNFNLKELMEE